MKVIFKMFMSKADAVEMAITGKIGDFSRDFGKVLQTFPHSNSVSNIFK